MNIVRHLPKATLMATLIAMVTFNLVQAAPARVSVTDPVGDNTGPVDVIGMDFEFNNETGNYTILLTATDAEPFAGDFRVNINLFNLDVGTTADDPSYFQDTINDFSVLVPSTALLLSGTNARLLSWDTGDRILLNNLPDGTPHPDGGTLFSSVVSARPSQSLENDVIGLDKEIAIVIGDGVDDGADDNLVYVAVEPCRLADTRKTVVMFNGVPRNFLVSGADLSAQGGDPSGCLHPRAGTGAEPLAASTYIVAIPTAVSVGGWLTAFPSDQPTPTSNSVATVNYTKGQVIGNASNVTLCEPGASCPASGQLGLVSYSSQQHMVIDVQGYFYPKAGSCSAEMVAVGSLCVDRYEASLWDAASGGTQIPASTCLADGSDCGADGLNQAIFAQSVAGVLPAAAPSWFQASIACANVGKRLPSSAEWQMAAAGTDANSCNVTSGALANTGASADCVSTAGAFDMVGNLWEWTADLRSDVASGGTSAQTSFAAGFGDSHTGLDPTPGTDTMFIPTEGTIVTNPVFGFRCVRY